ncbi:MAG TPA: PepSY-associated TM helix domain-containing protein [Lacunisphaera sp.]|jgi:uncharacterized iron-regulated membrane protein
MKRFRTILFWTHLTAGLIAGISIFIMCFTGSALAFQTEITAWAERDARQITPPTADAPRLSIDDLIRKVREAEPDTRPSGIVVSSNPRAAVAFTLGREGALYANPYTGEIRRPASTKASNLLHTLEDWHRVLAMGGDNRSIGRMINGVCNIAFCVLAITGLYLWFPRSWSWRNVRAVALFDWTYSGKARDFNWHNVIGLWCAPILIVLTLTAIPMSYRWGANLIYKIAGEEPPTPSSGGPGGLAAGPAVEVPTPAPGAHPLGNAAMIAAAQNEIPDWESITLRLGNGRGTSGRVSRALEESGAAAQPKREGEGRPQSPAVSVSVKEPGSWPRTATTALTLNPYMGEVLKREGFADLPASRRIRTWTRFLHTGQAVGWIGQLIAGLACLGGCVLAYTGFALAWRRFFGQKKSSAN